METLARRFLLAICVAIMGCMSDSQADVSVESDSLAIVALRQRFEQAVRGGNVDSLVILFDSAVVNMPPNGEPQVGLGQLRSWAEPRFSAPRPTATYDASQLRVAGEWAFELGSFGAEGVGAIGKRIWIFRRQADGAWRISHIMWSSNASPSDGS